MSRTKIDWDKFNIIFRDMLSSLERLRGKKVVIMVGTTGAGKSTQSRFICQQPLEAFTEEDGDPDVVKYKAVDDQVGAGIGSGLKSKTLYPEAHAIPDNADLMVLDTAGLEDNVSPERALAISLALKFITQRDSGITVQGIVIVGQKSAIMAEDRGAYMKKLFAYIAQMMPDVSADSVMYLVTGLKKPEDPLVHLRLMQRRVIEKVVAEVRTAAERLNVQGEWSQIDASESIKDWSAFDAWYQTRPALMQNETSAEMQQLRSYINSSKLMTPDNTFMMKGLTEEGADQLRQRIIDKMVAMPVFRGELGLAMDSDTEYQLKDWARESATQSNALLTTLSTAKKKAVELFDNKKQLTQLLDNLVLARKSLAEIKVERERFHVDEAEKEAVVRELSNRSHDLIERAIPLRFPGDQVLVGSYPMVVNLGYLVQEFQPSAGIRTISTDRTLGIFHGVYEHKSESLSLPAELGVKVSCKRSDLPEHQEALRAAREALRLHKARRVHLEAEYKAAERQVEQILATIAEKKEALKLEQQVEGLEGCEKMLKSKLALVTAELASTEEAVGKAEILVSAAQEKLQLLNQMLVYTEIHKQHDAHEELPRFMALYQQYLSRQQLPTVVQQNDTEAAAEERASQRPVSDSVVSLFGAQQRRPEDRSQQFVKDPFDAAPAGLPGGQLSRPGSPW